jgi:hypothetical protein
VLRLEYDPSKRTPTPLIPAQAGIQARLQTAGSPPSRGRAEQQRPMLEQTRLRLSAASAEEDEHSRPGEEKSNVD